MVQWVDLYLWDRAQPPELCPHIKASGIVVNRRVANQVGRIIDSLDLPQAAPDEISDEKVKPWVRLIEDMLLDSQLAAPLIRAILTTWIPKRHHGEVKSFRKIIPQPSPEPQQTFHKFPDLPPELRTRIWELAAEQPRHVLRWKLRHPPLDTRRNLPVVAKACKEAWDVVTSRAGNFCPPVPEWVRNEPDGPDILEWAPSEAVVMIEDPHSFDHTGLSYSLWCAPRDWGVDFARARREVSVHYWHFVRFSDHWAGYRLLRHSQKLDCLVVIVAKKVVYVAPNGVHMPDKELRRCYNHYEPQLDKLVMFDELDEIKRLDALWNEIGPQSYWLSRYDYWEWSEVGQRDSTSLPGGLRCLDCKMQRWRDEGEARIRSAWLRMVATTEPGHRTDPDIFPDGLEPNMDHPWVQGELRGTPKISRLWYFRSGSR